MHLSRVTVTAETDVGGFPGRLVNSLYLEIITFETYSYKMDNNTSIALGDVNVGLAGRVHVHKR